VTVSDSAVCPRCGTAAEDGRFCRACGLNLEEAGALPTHDQWLRERAEAPWPPSGEKHAAPRGKTRGPPRDAVSNAGRPADKPRWRSLLEVGIPLAVVVAVAVVVLLPHSQSAPAGSLHYDPHGTPLISSVRLGRAETLRTGSCHGCASVVPNAGGCSGYGTDWTCDVQVDVHRHSRQFLQVPSELETYKVTWNSTGCWQAIENCVSAADSSGHICPPPVPVYMHGCIRGAG
jgi:hypothetical protein